MKGTTVAGVSDADREADWPAVPDRSVLVGLVGENIAASRSPFLHEAEGAAHGLRLNYRLFDLATRRMGLADLPRMLDAMELVGFSGINVTHPYKQAVMPLLHELSDSARDVGAVNTVLFQGARRIGHNTDAAGFAEGFRRELATAKLDVVAQVGAGGAGAATATAMLRMGCGELRLFDSNADRAAALADRLAATWGAARVRACATPQVTLAGADGLVNATPVGMVGHSGLPLDPALLRPDMWVADVIYFPLRTQLLESASAMGCATINGSGMVVFQAALAFDLFTGCVADRERMLATFARLRGG